MGDPFCQDMNTQVMKRANTVYGRSLTKQFGGKRNRTGYFSFSGSVHSASLHRNKLLRECNDGVTKSNITEPDVVRHTVYYLYLTHLILLPPYFRFTGLLVFHIVGVLISPIHGLSGPFYTGWINQV